MAGAKLKQVNTIKTEIMYGKAGLILAMASMMAAEFKPPRRELREKPALSDAEKQAKQRELNLRKGLKEFYMGDGTVVWALNEKNAIRKFKRKTNEKRNIRRQ